MKGATNIAARPTMGGGGNKHSTPEQGGGHAPAQHQSRQGKQHDRNRNPTDDDKPSQTPLHHAPPPQPKGTNTARPTMRGATQQHSTPHHEGGHKSTQHAPPWAGPHTNTARPTIGGGTHQHSTPHHVGRSASAQNQPRPGNQHNHNRNPTSDHSHPNGPTVRRRRQNRKN